MIKFIKSFFSKKEEKAVEEAPYKVETPTIVASGEPPATVVVVEGAGVVEAAPKAKKAKAPAKAKKPATAKKPRKPKTPKA